MQHSLLRYALAFAFVLAGTGFAQAQRLAPEEAEALGIEQAAERPAATATRGDSLQVCVDDVLLAVDSSNDTVVILDPATGDVVNPMFIDDSVDDNLATPKNAIGNFDGDGIFVTEQLRDAIFEYDCSGNFVGVFADAGDGLDNIRGAAYNEDRTSLLVTVGDGTNEDTIVEIDSDGNFAGIFTAETGSPFDVLVRDSDVLVGEIDDENIYRYDFDGVLLDTLVDSDGLTGIDFPQQLNLASNGNVLAAGFSSPSGAYEYDGTTGAQVGFYGVVDGLRGIYELPNGNLLVTNGSGLFEITRSNTIVRGPYADANQYIELFAVAGDPDPIEIDASPDAQSVPQGGTASLSYTVSNNTALAQRGVVFFEVFRGPNRIIGPVAVQAGSLPAGQSVTSSFSLGVPSNAPPATYSVEVSAGPSNGVAAATDIVAVTVTEATRPVGSATEWTLVAAEPWPNQDAAPAAAATAPAVGVFPNPLHAQATIRYEVAEAAEVRLAVYDVLGRTVAVLAEGRVEAGVHTASFDARGLSAGTYVYRLEAGGTVQTGRLTVVN